MSRKLAGFVLVAAVILLAVMFPLGGCSSKTSTSPTKPGIGGGAIINSDSVVTAEIKAIRKQATGFPWELDIVIKTAEAVGNLPNPVADKTGQMVTVKTDEDLSAFKSGQIIAAKIKYVGDVPKPGITLYLYNVKTQ
jgi:hypothetical protein